MGYVHYQALPFYRVNNAHDGAKNAHGWFYPINIKRVPNTMSERTYGHVLNIPVTQELHAKLLEAKQLTKTPVSEMGRIALEAYLDALEGINSQP